MGRAEFVDQSQTQLYGGFILKILYVAKFDCGDNDDENAIAYALEQLGHTVYRAHQNPAMRSPDIFKLKYDLCLFHKWDEFGIMTSLKCPKVFWYFDLVYSGDPSMDKRDMIRTEWMSHVMPLVSMGFCTDGDWAARYPDKLRWLMQGADERFVGPAIPDPTLGVAPIIFTGTIRHGLVREQEIARLRTKYGNDFQVIGAGGDVRYHGRTLASILCSAKIVIAPKGPSTDRYWSNRVYLTTGFGGLLLHPDCAGLRGHYGYLEVLKYANDEQLDSQIDFYLRNPDRADTIAKAGFERTKHEHLYRHRCISLLGQVKGIL